MKSKSANGNLVGFVWLGSAVVWACLCPLGTSAQPTPSKATPAAATVTTEGPQKFETRSRLRMR
jgi:hypothetical protein